MHKMIPSTSDYTRRPLKMENLLRGTGSGKPDLAFRLIRLLIALEHGFFAICLTVTLVLVVGNFTGVLFAIPFLIALGVFYYSLCAFGVSLMDLWLRSVRDRRTVELCALIAIGLAPLSSVFHPLIFLYLLGRVHPHADLYAGLLPWVAAVGFYLPFILAVFWLRYHHREDEF